MAGRFGRVRRIEESALGANRSRIRHSRYLRTLKDLPALGVPLSLKVRVSRFRRRNLECGVLFFAGTLPGIAEVRSRRTRRADVIVRLIGHALGGRPVYCF